MFSKSTEYALRATIFIARTSSEDNKVSIKAIAEGIGAPRAFTAKTLQQLTKDKTIILSTPGPSGGFYMTEKAKKRPIYEVIQLMGESHTIESCVLGLPYCNDSQPCSMHNTYKHIRKDLKNMFQNKSIQELADSNEFLLRL